MAIQGYLTTDWSVTTQPLESAKFMQFADATIDVWNRSCNHKRRCLSSLLHVHPQFVYVQDVWRWFFLSTPYDETQNSQSSNPYPWLFIFHIFTVCRYSATRMELMIKCQGNSGWQRNQAVSLTQRQPWLRAIRSDASSSHFLESVKWSDDIWK